MKKYVLFFCVLVSLNIFSQSSQGTESRATSFPQGFGLGLLNSYGTSSIYNDVSNLSSMNPASIVQFNNYSLGLSYQFSTNIKDGYYADIDVSRIHNITPQSFGSVLKFDEITLGLSFGQGYNMSLDFGLIPITTEENPYGTGELFSPTMETAMQDFSITSAYSFGNIFSNDNLNVGLRFSLGRFYDYTKLYRYEFDAEDYSPALSAGIFYTLLIDENHSINLGLMYQSKIEFDGKVESNSPSKVFDPDPRGDSSIYVIDVVPFISAHFPDQINSDLSIDITSKLKLLTSLSLILWKSQPSLWDNQLIYSTSAVLKFNEVTSASIGFSSSDLTIREENYFYNRENFFNVFFITAGLKLSTNNFNIDIALADSHLMSGKFREQTIGKIALGLTL
ncbi:MAG: hypothetical protein IPM56_12375 [Ignavibacteriales bacterium]|nr:MAG: hypothetical protein IPM56_12375 [Ignavibacteriales bacterium]